MSKVWGEKCVTEGRRIIGPILESGQYELGDGNTRGQIRLTGTHGFSVRIAGPCNVGACLNSPHDLNAMAVVAHLKERVVCESNSDNGAVARIGPRPRLAGATATIDS